MGRNGSGWLYWEGSEEDLDALFAWIEKYVPSGEYSLPEDDWSDWPEGLEHRKTNRHAHFTISAMMFICYWWARYKGPDLFVPWELRTGPPQFMAPKKS